MDSRPKAGSQDCRICGLERVNWRERWSCEGGCWLKFKLEALQPLVR